MTDGGADDGIRQQANTWGRIIQIVDKSTMIVGIDNGAGSPGGAPRYSVTVWCKFPTKGLTDGKTGFLADIIGTSKITVTGTTDYNTASGKKTVFVLEPYKPSPEEKKAADQRAADVAAEKKALDALPEAAKQFVGRWTVLTTDGKPSSYLNLGATYKASREHVSGDAGKWEFVGGEARITYDNGWHSVIRPNKNKASAWQIASYSPGVDPGPNWAAKPSATQTIVKPK
jgi:hypothetical protein